MFFTNRAGTSGTVGDSSFKGIKRVYLLRRIHPNITEFVILYWANSKVNVLIEKDDPYDVVSSK